jgi:MFS family permease
MPIADTVVCGRTPAKHGAPDARSEGGARHGRSGTEHLSGASRRFTLAAILSSSLGVGLIFGFQPPLIAMVLSRAGSSALAIGAVSAASLIAVILCGPLYPLLIGRLGLRRSVMAGISTGAVVLAFMPAVSGAAPWTCFRFVTGCALGLSWIASEIWLNTVSGDAERGTVMGIYGTVFSVGIIGGPILLEFTGTEGWRPFVVGALCLLATLLPILMLRGAGAGTGAGTGSGTGAGTAGGAATRTPLVDLVRAVRFAPIVMLAALVAGLVESADLALLPLFGLHAGLNERAALFLVTVFMAGNVVLQMPIGLLADRFGRRTILGGCAVASALGPSLLPVCLEAPVWLGLLLFLWGGTLYGFYSQGIALLGEEFPASELASANTVFVMVYCAGGVIGPSLGGFAMDRWPQAGLPAMVGGAPLLMLAGLAVRAMRAAKRVTA